MFLHADCIVDLLNGEEGWWIGAKHLDALGVFVWSNSYHVVTPNHVNWGVKRLPFESTCLWLRQHQPYQFMFENHDCTAISGFICEIQLLS